VRIFDPRVFVAVWRARRTGARQTQTQGDALQLGGVLVFAASGRLGWRHVGRFPGDHAAPQDILDALRRLAPPSEPTADRIQPHSALHPILTADECIRWSRATPPVLLRSANVGAAAGRSAPGVDE